MARLARLVPVALLGVLAIPLFTTRIQARGDTGGPHMTQYGEVDVRTLPATASATASRTLPFRSAHPDVYRRYKAQSGLLGQSIAPSSGTLSSVNVADTGFDGVSFGVAGTIPPDTQVAVGSSYIFEAVNGRVRIWSRATGAFVIDKSLSDFFGVSFLSDIVSDPRVRFDTASGRWFVSLVTIESLFGTSEWRLAVSQTSDPTGTFKLYAVTFNDGSYPDFPSLGINDDKLVLTGNSFDMSSGAFLGAEFMVVRKADLVAGMSTPVDTIFHAPQIVDSIQVDSIQAAQSLSSTATLYMAAIAGDGQTSNLQLWALNGVPGVGSGVTVSSRTLTMAAPVVQPPDAVQKGSGVLVVTNDARLDNLSYRDGSLWMGSSTSCVPANDTVARACLHFVQVSTSTLSITQELTFGEAGTYYYYPAVEIDASGNLVTVFNRSSSTEYASVYAGGQAVADGPGTFRTPALVRSGQNAYDPSAYNVPPRWGDYSGAAIDPADSGASVWVAGEYMGLPGGANWGTWIARVSFGGGCTLAAPPAGLTPTAGNGQVALAWTPSSLATSYNVKRSTTSGGPYSNIANVTATGYTDTAVTNGTTYYYVVSSVNACGEGGISGQVSATPTGTTTTAAPTNLKAASNAKRRISLTWTQSASAGITQNKVYRSTSSTGPFAVVATLPGSVSYTDPGLTSGRRYYYYVTAVSSAGESAFSNQASATAR